MRVIFAGTSTVSVPALHLLHQHAEVVGVITRAPARGRRGKELLPSPVEIAAVELGLPITHTLPNSPEFRQQIELWQPDIAAVVAYGHILPSEVLAQVPHGWINLHFSLLPAWRGAAPVQRAIMAGDSITGASTFLLEAGMDTGPIIGMVTTEISGTDTAGSLLERLAREGAPLLLDSLQAVFANFAQLQPQGSDGVSHASKITKAEAKINWELPAHIIDRLIRGTTPNPGAWTVLPDGNIAKIGPVTIVPNTVLAPGNLAFEAGKVLVGTGTTPVALGEITPAGKKTLAANDWWRGARLEGGVLGDG